MINHIKNLSHDSLARKIWLEQITNFWPGLSQEVREICEDLSIPDINRVDMSKTELKKLVTSACMKRDEDDLKKLMQGGKKLKHLINEDCQIKP